MTRRKFNTAIRLDLAARQKGLCACGCGIPIDDSAEADHITELALGGEDCVTNLQMLRPECHKAKTAERIRMIRKADRIKRKAEGKIKLKRKIASRGFNKSLRKLMNGTVVPREPQQ